MYRILLITILSLSLTSCVIIKSEDGQVYDKTIAEYRQRNEIVDTVQRHHKCYTLNCSMSVSEIISKRLDGQTVEEEWSFIIKPIKYTDMLSKEFKEYTYTIRFNKGQKGLYSFEKEFIKGQGQ